MLINVRQNYDDINVLHIVSGGPTTQWQNRYHLCSAIPVLFGFKLTWWNLSVGKAVVDSQLMFMDCDAGWPGSVHDARVFKNSPLPSFGAEVCSPNLF